MGGSSDGVWAPQRRRLTAGLLLTITLVAFEALAIATALPAVAEELDGVALYGWVFAAFMLSSLVGTVLAGRQADVHGPGLPFLWGLGLYAVGLVVAGVAWSMPVVVAGRVIQGLGAGTVAPVALAAVGRAYPERLRPRVFALTSTAWVLPGLAGPGVASVVAQTVGWRWVFLGIVPLVPLCGALVLPAYARLGPPDDGAAVHRVSDAVRVAVGAGAVLAALSEPHPVRSPLLLAGAAVVGGRALLRLLPPGTLRASVGLPAAVLSRAAIAFAVFGADAFVPLLVTGVRGGSLTTVGVVLTVGTLSWTAGSWVQDRRSPTVGPARLVGEGLALIAAGIAAMAAVLSSAVPVWTAAAAWLLMGLGAGVCYPAATLLVLREAPPGREGAASSSMTIAETIGIALGTGIGGAFVAVAERSARIDLSVGVGAAFALTGAVAAVGVALVPRLRAPLSHGRVQPSASHPDRPVGAADLAE